MPSVPKPTRQLGRHFLRQWRKHRGLSQERAAERIGMSRENLSKIERGIVPYDEPLLIVAAEVYQCDPPDLIMRNPLDTEAPWSIWATLKPAEKRQAIEVIKTLKRISDEFPSARAKCAHHALFRLTASVHIVHIPPHVHPASEPGGGWERKMGAPHEWTIEMEPGAICRSIMWNGKEVAHVNPRGDFTDETERDIAAGLCFAAELHRTLKLVAGTIYVLPEHTQREVRRVLDAIETVDTKSYVERADEGELDDEPAF